MIRPSNFSEPPCDLEKTFYNGFDTLMPTFYKITDTKRYQKLGIVEGFMIVADTKKSKLLVYTAHGNVAAGEVNFSNKFVNYRNLNITSMYLNTKFQGKHAMPAILKHAMKHLQIGVSNLKNELSIGGRKMWMTLSRKRGVYTEDQGDRLVAYLR